MIKISCISMLLVLFAASVLAQPPLVSGKAPTLVLSVMVDQMRYDYLTRYGADFDGGLKRLMREGAVFTSANYEAMPTVTAVGHSTVLSGATPSLSGIAGNTWYSRSEGRNVQSITDPEVRPLGTANGASPKRLLVSTIGDELKASGRGGKVYGVSLKDRSAILPAGRSADGAFWLDNGNFVSSSWYFPELPAWACGGTGAAAPSGGACMRAQPKNRRRNAAPGSTSMTRGVWPKTWAFRIMFSTTKTSSRMP